MSELEIIVEGKVLARTKPSSLNETIAKLGLKEKKLGKDYSIEKAIEDFDEEGLIVKRVKFEIPKMIEDLRQDCVAGEEIEAMERSLFESDHIEGQKAVYGKILGLLLEKNPHFFPNLEVQARFVFKENEDGFIEYQEASIESINLVKVKT